MADNVFTILFHGTGEHRDKGDENKEVLHEITKLLVGEEYVNWLVCDGPGASPPSGQQHNPLPGSFQIDDRKKSPKQKSVENRYATYIRDYNGYVSHATGVYSKMAYNHLPLWLRGMLMGEGMDDNIRHAIVVLASRFETGNFTVNLLGWSRGGVSCIRAANWFYEIWKERITVNIFAFDPVPGADLGETIHDTHTLSSCVKSYFSVLCLHDKRSTFKPVDLRSLVVPPSSPLELALVPLPGFHATPLYFEPGNTPLHACPEVGRYLAWKFLSLHGTPLRDDTLNAPSKFTPAHLCELYASMMLDLDKYGVMDWSTWFYQRGESPWGLQSRDVLTNRHDYVRRGSSSYFLNEHHLTCFKTAFPALAQHLGLPQVWPSPPVPASRLVRAVHTVIDLKRELDRMRPTSTFKLLWERLGLQKPPDSTWLPEAGALKAQAVAPQVTPEMRAAQSKGYRLLFNLMEAA